MLVVSGMLVGMGILLLGGSWRRGNSAVWLAFYYSCCLLLGSLMIMSSFLGVSCEIGNSMLVDVISMSFIILTILVTLVSLGAMVLEVSGSGVGALNMPQLSSCMVWLAVFMSGMFCISSGLYFFICFELCVIPIFMMIMLWGAQKERVFSSYYFFLYSVVTPGPLLLAVLKGAEVGNYHFDLLSFSLGNWGFSYIELGALVIGFLTKLPIYGLHIWLPKAHVDAPVGSSMVLASVMLKMSAFGIMRVSLASFFNYGGSVSFIITMVGLLGFVFAGAMCLRVVDYKVAVAFSSVCHMSVTLAGIMLSSSWAYLGSFYVYLGHSVISPLLFYLSSVFYSRSGSRLILGHGSLGTFWGPSVYMLFLLGLMFNFSFPPFINFFGELGVFSSIVGGSLFSTIFLAVGFILSSVWAMNMFAGMAHSGSVGTNPPLVLSHTSSQLSSSEWSLAMSLVSYYLAMSLGLSVVM